MTLKERVEKHPLALIASIFVAGASMSGGALQYMHQHTVSSQVSQHQAEVGKLTIANMNALEEMKREAAATQTAYHAQLREAEATHTAFQAELRDAENLRQRELDAVKATADQERQQVQAELDALTARSAQELDALRSRLASIRLGMADKAYLDVRTLMHDRADSQGIPSDSQLFDGLFYAGATLDDFSHSRTTELDMVSMQLTEEQATALRNVFEVYEPMKQFNERWPIHLWRESTSRSIENHVLFGAAATFVAVQVVPVDEWVDFLKQLGRLTPAASQVRPESAPSTGTASALDELGDKLRDDVVGSFVASRMQTQLAALGLPRTMISLDTAQKVGNVFYSRELITLGDVVVDRKPFDRYYIRRDTIVIASGDHMYLVMTNIPSEDTSSRGEAFAKVTQWLGQFRALT